TGIAARANATDCAGGSSAIYQKHAASFQWPVYCPTFLPPGFELEFAQPPDLARDDRGLSDVKFRNGDQTIEIMQGYILTTLPRDDAGLPISRPTKDGVMFGDVPSQL